MSEKKQTRHLINPRTMERIDPVPERDALRTAVRTLSHAADQYEYVTRTSEATPEDIRKARELSDVATWLHTLYEQMP